MLCHCMIAITLQQFGWDPDIISASLGGALQFARDWGELAFESAERLAVRHDVESPWMGLAFWGVVYDPASHAYAWARPGWRDQPHATAAELQALRTLWFEPPLNNRTNPFTLLPNDLYEGRWVLSPTAIAMNWLSRCGDESAVAVPVRQRRMLGGRIDRQSTASTGRQCLRACATPRCCLLRLSILIRLAMTLTSSQEFRDRLVVVLMMLR